MNSKRIFTGIAKQYKDKEMLLVDPKSAPKMREGLYVGTVNHHVIVSSGNGGKNRKNKTIHAERE